LRNACFRSFPLRSNQLSIHYCLRKMIKRHFGAFFFHFVVENI
jgi:hypothetical protein